MTIALPGHSQNQVKFNPFVGKERSMHIPDKCLGQNKSKPSLKVIDLHPGLIIKNYIDFPICSVMGKIRIFMKHWWPRGHHI